MSKIFHDTTIIYRSFHLDDITKKYKIDDMTKKHKSIMHLKKKGIFIIKTKIEQFDFEHFVRRNNIEFDLIFNTNINYSYRITFVDKIKTSDNYFFYILSINPYRDFVEDALKIIYMNDKITITPMLGECE